AALAGGSIDYLKAKIIADETSVLDDALAAQAEALILADLAGKTPGQVGRLAAAAVAAVDPAGGGAAAAAGRGRRCPGAVLAGAGRDQRAGRLRPAHRRRAIRQR